MRVFIGLGGNQGEVISHFKRSLLGLSTSGVLVKQISSLYKTVALVSTDYAHDCLAYEQEAPFAAPNVYWNAVCTAETTLTPQEVLHVMQFLEQRAGRVYPKQRLPQDNTPGWLARPLDLDLLLYGDQVIEEADLRVPHPELAKRPFVLQPLVELDRNLLIPKINFRVIELLNCLHDPRAGIIEIRRDWWSN